MGAIQSTVYNLETVKRPETTAEEKVSRGGMEPWLFCFQAEHPTASKTGSPLFSQLFKVAYDIALLCRNELEVSKAYDGSL